MNKNPLVSVIIPVYNDAEYLHESLDSVVNQTLKDIEIIVVNDGSTDNSLEIMNEYAAKDSRVRIINRPENGSALMARKDGIAAATGDYTMFLDGDDRYAPSACETAYDLIVKNDVDILGFSHLRCRVDSNGNVTNTLMVNPALCSLGGGVKILHSRKEIQDFYLLEKKAYTDAYLWNKIFETTFLKISHENIKKFYCTLLNDYYEYYYISYYAKKAAGLSTEPLYVYYMGHGITGNKNISLENFEKHCHIIRGTAQIKKFLEREGTFEEQKKYLEAWKERIPEFCSYVLFNRVPPEDFDQAVKILYRYFNEEGDTERTTRYLLTELRRKINWANDLVKTRDWLRKQIEVKDARIEELHGWCEEQDKAKQCFLSQIAYKDAIIADLEQNSNLKRLFKRKVKNRLRKIADKVFPKGTRSREMLKAVLRKIFPKRFPAP